MSDKKLRDHHQNENRNHLQAGYPRQDKIFKEVLKKIDKGGTILEIGFGDGYLLNKLSKVGYNIFGQDLSEKNIETTKKQRNNKNIAFLLGDVSGKLLKDDNSIDGFIASEVLEHMTDDELEFCIKEIHRILKKGGYAFITFPAKENLKSSECICPKCGEIFHKWGHKQYWDTKKIKESFTEFEIIKCNEFFNRYTGNKFIEKIIGYFMLFSRNILNNFIELNDKNYFLILKKL